MSLLLTAGTASAAEVIAQDGIVSEILDLEVNGEFWDITFVHESPETAYPGDVYDVKTEEDAMAVVTAVVATLNPFDPDLPTPFNSVGPDGDLSFYIAFQRVGADVMMTQGWTPFVGPQEPLRWVPDDKSGAFPATSVWTFIQATLSVPVESSSWSPDQGALPVA